MPVYKDKKRGTLASLRDVQIPEDVCRLLNWKEFYFLGEILAEGNPIPIKMEKTNDDAFEINYRLDVPVRDDIYEHIVSEA